jgi:porphobilinogen synthase
MAAAGPTCATRLRVMAFPATRLRRLRRTGALRVLVRETELSPSHLVLPLFVQLGTEERTPIDAMPGVARHSIALAIEEARAAHGAGVPAVLLFGVPADKDDQASGAHDEEGVVQLATRAIKDAVPDLAVITDVCLCGFMSHGHCGVVRPDGEVDNDVTLELLAKTAISHAEAGADAVAPSDMMDGRVGALRSQLDAEGHSGTPIVSYAAKFASAFYGPFREAAGSAPAFGDRRSYQMDPSNADEAVREALLDVDEGADMVMVKPALPYLDVIAQVKEATRVPVAAYNVSGEYAMVKAAAAAGLLDERAAVLEALVGIRRAGADVVVSYHAREVAEWLS